MKQLVNVIMLVAAFIVSGISFADGIPDVSGLDEIVASSALDSAGVSIVKVEHVCNSKVPLNQVISQTNIIKDSLVETTLIVSKGDCLITIPNLAGHTLESAEQYLDRIALNVGDISYTCGGEAGRVLSHDPAADTHVEPCSTVNLVVSDGPCITPVPVCTGGTETEAIAACTNAGLVVDVVYQYDDTVPSGNVISQYPAQGTEIEENSPVQIVVSLGQAPASEGEPDVIEGEPVSPIEGEGEFDVDMVRVPDITGMTLAEARDTLESAGFTVRTEQRSSPGCNPVPEGSIISQQPAPGTQAPAGSQVAIRVSTGSGPLGTIIGGIFAAILFLFSCLFGFCPPAPTVIG